MKIYIVLAVFIFQSTKIYGQVGLYSPQYKVLNLIVNSIDNFKKDPVFQKYNKHQKEDIYYNMKNTSINYLTMRQKFGIDTNRKYHIELKDVTDKNEFHIYNVKDSARLHIAKGDVIISLFQPVYCNGYIYIMAFARNDGSTYGGRISNFLFILDDRMKIVKYYYLKEII